MPVLDCSVKNCNYNKSDCCCRGNINVEGENAKDKSATCCNSFAEKRGDSTSNSTFTPDSTLSVDCSATTCQFNDKCACTANHIGISGANACRCDETECGSFCCK